MNAWQSVIAEALAAVDRLPDATPEIMDAKAKLTRRLAKMQLEQTNSAAPSDRGLAFADWFRSTLDPSAILPMDCREQWARCFDDMLRLDHRSPEDVWKVCRWARANSFWGSRFLSPLKLRQRDSSRILYFDQFAARMAADKPASSARAAVEDGKQYQEGTKARRL